MKNQEEILEFGIKRENEERRDGACAVVFDPQTQLYAVGEHESDGFLRLFSGGIDEKEKIQECALREVIEESGLNDFLYIENIGEVFAHYHNSLRKVNRIAKATCFLIILNSRNSIEVKLEEHEKFHLVWVSSKEILSNWEKTRDEKDKPEHWIYFLNKAVKRAIELGYDKTNTQS